MASKFFSMKFYKEIIEKCPLKGHLGDNCIQNFHLWRYNVRIRSDIELYGDA